MGLASTTGRLRGTEHYEPHSLEETPTSYTKAGLLQTSKETVARLFIIRCGVHVLMPYRCICCPRRVSTMTEDASKMAAAFVFVPRPLWCREYFCVFRSGLPSLLQLLWAF